jgi:hypothetical protein
MSRPALSVLSELVCCVDMRESIAVRSRLQPTTNRKLAEVSDHVSALRRRYAQGTHPGTSPANEETTLREPRRRLHRFTCEGCVRVRRGARRRDSPAGPSRYATIPSVPSLQRHCNVTTYLLITTRSLLNQSL